MVLRRHLICCPDCVDPRCPCVILKLHVAPCPPDRPGFARRLRAFSSLQKSSGVSCGCNWCNVMARVLRSVAKNSSSREDRAQAMRSVRVNLLKTFEIEEFSYATRRSKRARLRLAREWKQAVSGERRSRRRGHLRGFEVTEALLRRRPAASVRYLVLALAILHADGDGGATPIALRPAEFDALDDPVDAAR
jgi:hypothetical protein